MPTPATLVLLYVPCGSFDEARRIARALLDARLIACANLHPIRSLYRWAGVPAEEDEVVLLAKTTADHADAAEALIAARHSFTTPAILRLPGVGANAAYAAWVAGEVGPEPDI